MSKDKIYSLLLGCRAVYAILNEYKERTIVRTILETRGYMKDYEEFYDAVEIIKEIASLPDEVLKDVDELEKRMNKVIIQPYSIDKEEHTASDLLNYHSIYSMFFTERVGELNNDQLDQVFDMAKLLIKDEKLLTYIGYQVRIVKERNAANE